MKQVKPAKVVTSNDSNLRNRADLRYENSQAHQTETETTNFRAGNSTTVNLDTNRALTEVENADRDLAGFEKGKKVKVDKNKKKEDTGSQQVSCLYDEKVNSM